MGEGIRRRDWQQKNGGKSGLNLNDFFNDHRPLRLKASMNSRSLERAGLKGVGCAGEMISRGCSSCTTVQSS